LSERRKWIAENWHKFPNDIDIGIIMNELWCNTMVDNQVNTIKQKLALLNIAIIICPKQSSDGSSQQNTDFTHWWLPIQTFPTKISLKLFHICKYLLTMLRECDHGWPLESVVFVLYKKRTFNKWWLIDWRHILFSLDWFLSNSKCNDAY
jgi:hypothetical protein